MNEIVAAASQQVEKMFPNSIQHFELGTAVMWNNIDWVRGGAFAFLRPGQYEEWSREVTLPAGQFFFAGEHCSNIHGWIEGALDSSIKACLQIQRKRVSMH